MKTLTSTQKRMILAAATIMLIFLSTTPLLTQTPKCGHVILITAPGHASSWFLHSVESCTNNSLDIKSTTELPSTGELSQSMRVSKLDQRLRTWIARRDAPVVVLRRDVPGAYRQFVEDGGVLPWSEWERNIEGFFVSVEELLKDVNVHADWIWYNDIVRESRLYLDHAGCYIDNCDFME